MNIEKQGKRNAVSRSFHARNDKEKIAAWKLELGRFLQVFNVSPTVSLWLLLTLHPQTELAITTHVIVSDTQAAVSDVHHEVLNTHTIVSKVDHAVTSNHTMISEIHRTVVKGQDGQSVSDSCSTNHRMATHRCVDPSQVSDPDPPMHPLSHIRI